MCFSWLLSWSYVSAMYFFCTFREYIIKKLTRLTPLCLLLRNGEEAPWGEKEIEWWKFVCFSLSSKALAVPLLFGLDKDAPPPSCTPAQQRYWLARLYDMTLNSGLLCNGVERFRSYFLCNKPRPLFISSDRRLVSKKWLYNITKNTIKTNILAVTPFQGGEVCLRVKKK
jgi:hypothetical protein